MSRKERHRSLLKAYLLCGWKLVKKGDFDYCDKWPSFSLKEFEKSLELGNIINRGIELKIPICNETIGNIW
jgi:hypothetical protein